MLFASSEGCAAITRCCTDTWLTAARSFTVSYGMFARRLGLMTCAVTTTPRVWPSGADFATRSVPTTVPAPGRFSTTTGCPHTSCIFAATRRPTMSVAPPGGNGTIILTGLVGKAGAGPSQKKMTRMNLNIDSRSSAAANRILSVEPAEVVARALAALRGHAVRLEEVELARHLAKAGRVQPQPHEAPLALGLGMVPELRARMHHGVVVDHHHLAGLEVEGEPVLRRLGDLVEQVEGGDVFSGERHAALAVAGRDARPLIAATQLVIDDRENRYAIRRGRLFVRAFLAEPVIVVSAIERRQQLGRAPADLVVHRDAAHQHRSAARAGLPPAGERDHGGDVVVRPQLQVAAVHARRRILRGRVDDVADELALRVLRQGRAEMPARVPHRGAELVQRPLVRKAPDEHDAGAGANLLVRRLQVGIDADARDRSVGAPRERRRSMLISHRPIA